MKIAAYLNFDGNCAEALRHYAEALGGTITFMQTFAESPMADQVQPEKRDLVMHATLNVGDQMLLGSDSIYPYEKPKACAVCLQQLSVSQAEQVWEALSQGAEVEMPLQQTFWSARFGMLRDRFGVPWMINAEGEG